jgi:predicted nucleic acid-binding protein
MATERDPSKFHKLNVVDSCAIWNIISTQLLRTTAYSVGCSFCCTDFVYYECLYKPRTKIKPEDIVLQALLRQEMESERFKNYHLDIEDLQEIDVLQKRKNLGKGELASIAFAKKTYQAFLTDDRGARNLAEEVLTHHMVQTTAHLLGWLFFESFLSDGDLHQIIDEHKKHNGKLETYFIVMYERALDFRSKQHFTHE